MRTALFLATLTVAAAAARAQQPAPGGGPGQAATPGEQKAPEAGKPAAAPAEQKVGEAPSLPAGETAVEAAAPAPDTGTIGKVNVQGNRRVETDAIRAVLPLKQGDTYDKEKLKAALL